MDLRERVAGALSRDVVALSPLRGGCVAQVALGELRGGERVVIKWSDSPGAGLDTEAFMLRTLAGPLGELIPRVLHGEDDLLVMTHVPNDGVRTDAGMRRLGDALAALHGVSADAFGLDRDTLVGPLPQPNPWTEGWPAFYGRWRLRAMAELAHGAGGLDGRDLERVGRLCDRLGDLLGTTHTPELVHGDLWSGNVLWNQGSLAALIDPGCYFGVGEVDLAMMDLFGGFTGAFWDRYREARGIPDQVWDGFWRVRKGIYQLYPLLVHVRLFGGGYAGQARAVLDRFVG